MRGPKFRRGARAWLALVLIVPLIGTEARAEFQPRQHDCVGNPPRQTEDPLSPACVPFFDGDNGGATSPGVTADEIRVVLYNDDGVDGDMTLPWQESDEGGYPTDTYTTNLVRTIKAQLRYFQSHYQTYNRRVRVFAYSSGGGRGTTCAQRQGEALATDRELKPLFAAAVLSEYGHCYVRELSYYKVVSFAYGSDYSRKLLDSAAPYAWSFMSDQETESAYSASFICRKLKGRPARFANDPLLQSKTRSFGLIFPEQSQRGTQFGETALLLQQKVQRECGMTFDAVRVFAGSPQAAQIMSEFKLAGITTVACYCIPQQNELHAPQFLSAATALGYFPEWYWDHGSTMDRAMWHQIHGNKAQRSFGVTSFWRQPAFEEQYPYRAYLQQEPGTTPNRRFNWEIYRVFLELFSAIQTAGPNLTSDTSRLGMFTRSQNNPDPFLPGGGYGSNGTSRYSFVDTGMGWWWDPVGAEPGDIPGKGCMRVSREGKRFRAGAWPAGDEDLFVDQDPCTGSVMRYLP